MSDRDLAAVPLVRVALGPTWQGGGVGIGLPLHLDVEPVGLLYQVSTGTTTTDELVGDAGAAGSDVHRELASIHFLSPGNGHGGG